MRIFCHKAVLITFAVLNRICPDVLPGDSQSTLSLLNPTVGVVNLASAAPLHILVCRVLEVLLPLLLLLTLEATGEGLPLQALKPLLYPLINSCV